MKLVGKSIDHRGHREHRGESQRNHKSDLNAESAEERRVEHDLFPPLRYSVTSAFKPAMQNSLRFLCAPCDLCGENCDLKT